MLVCNHLHLQGQPGQQELAGGRAVAGDGKVAVVEEGGMQGRTVRLGLG